MASLDITTNADQVAADLVGVVEDAVARADQEAAETALRLVGPRTPRRSGALAAGLRTVVAPGGAGFALVDAQPYAGYVDARTGFASETLANAEPVIADIYAASLQAGFDAVGT